MYPLSNRTMARQHARQNRRQLERPKLDQPADIQGRSIALLVKEDFFFPRLPESLELFDQYPYLREVYVTAVFCTPISELSSWGHLAGYKSESISDYLMSEFYSLAVEFIESLCDDCDEEEVLRHHEVFGDAYAVSAELMYWSTDELVQRLIKIENGLENRHPDIWMPGKMAVECFLDNAADYRLVYYQYRIPGTGR